ncbi:disulfide bond formation protein DsbA [Streptomyces sp. NPDC006798]|uniref:mycothiol-dependent nitroreductase Rv2466c family protein n=1 Tax=Streptomyces sp. NPDC006798 TaxID=3155462 RepID=UPI0033D0BEF8
MDVDFWFDPVCPYTYLTSRWLREAAAVRPLSVRWRVMSLAVLNEHRDDDPEGDWGEYLWAPVRVCAAVERRYGSDALGAFLGELGAAFHLDGEWDAIPGALERAGLPPGAADTAWTTEYDDAVRASHAEAVALVGTDVGTPVLGVPGPGGSGGPGESGGLSGPGGGRIGLFGPVVSPVPTGEAAGRLWDGFLLLASVPGFQEIKRTRTESAPRLDGLR